MKPAFTTENDGALLVIACKAAHEYKGVDDPALHHLQRLLGLLDDLCARHGVRKIQKLGPLYVVTAEERPTLPCPVHVLYQYVCDAFLNTQGWQDPDSGNPLLLQSALHVGRLTSGILGITCVRYSVYGTVLHIAQQLLDTCPRGALHLSHEAFESLPKPPRQSTVALVRMGTVEMHTHIVSQDVLIGSNDHVDDDDDVCCRKMADASWLGEVEGKWDAPCEMMMEADDGMLQEAMHCNKDCMFFTLLLVVALAQYAVTSMHVEDAPALILCMMTTITIAALLLITSTTQPLQFMHWHPLLVASSVLLTLMCNSAMVAWCTSSWLTALQRVAILTTTHAVILNTTPLCCADLMPRGLLYCCIVLPTVCSATVAQGLLSTVEHQVQGAWVGGAWLLDGTLFPHVLTSGATPLLLALCVQYKGNGGGVGPSAKQYGGKVD